MGHPEDTAMGMDPFDLADALPAIAPGYTPREHAKASQRTPPLTGTTPPGRTDAALNVDRARSALLSACLDVVRKASDLASDAHWSDAKAHPKALELFELANVVSEKASFLDVAMMVRTKGVGK